MCVVAHAAHVSAGKRSPPTLPALPCYASSNRWKKPQHALDRPNGMCLETKTTSAFRKREWDQRPLDEARPVVFVCACVSNGCASCCVGEWKKRTSGIENTIICEASEQHLEGTNDRLRAFAVACGDWQMVVWSEGK